MLSPVRSLILLSAFRLVAAPAADLPSRFYDAIRNDDRHTVESLSKSPEFSGVKDKYGTTPLMYSAAVGSLASVKTLSDAGADVNAKNAFDVTALMLCAADEAKVRFLLSKGADPNARSKQGRTALLIAAATEGNSGILKILFAAGADLKKADASPGDTPLNAAINANDTAMSRLLLDHGAEVQGPTGEAALFSAAGSGNLELMRLLIEAGVPVDRASPAVLAPPVKNGNIALGLLTPLHAAAPTGGVEAVKLLLDRGANSNKQDVRGMTALMLAIGSDHPDVRAVKLLLERGADLSLKSKAGETAVDWARKFNNPEILAALGTAPAPLKATAASRPLPVREAVQKSSDLLQRNSANFFKEGGCASCHSHNLVSMALEKAQAAGAWKGDAPIGDARRGQTKYFWSSQQQALMLRVDAPGGHDMVAYAVLQLIADKVKPDAMTDAMVHNVAAQQQLNGSWRNFGVVRPPMQDSNLTSTALAIRSLSIYGPAGRKEELSARIARAVAWLSAADSITAEDRNMQLLGLIWGGASRDVVDPVARKILAQQQSDGGWAQTHYLASDAYATGQSLSALEEAGVSGNDPAYRKGAEFLLRTQRSDGSWYVASRSPKFQPYFQGGFPYDHDQWISMAATAWATMGLAHAVPEVKAVARR